MKSRRPRSGCAAGTRLSHLFSNRSPSLGQTAKQLVQPTQRLREPKDNKGMFVVLGEAGILSQETVAFMAPMAETKNTYFA